MVLLQCIALICMAPVTSLGTKSRCQKQFPTNSVGSTRGLDSWNKLLNGGFSVRFNRRYRTHKNQSASHGWLHKKHMRIEVVIIKHPSKKNYPTIVNDWNYWLPCSLQWCYLVPRRTSSPALLRLEHICATAAERQPGPVQTAIHIGIGKFANISLLSPPCRTSLCIHYRRHDRKVSDQCKQARWKAYHKWIDRIIFTQRSPASPIEHESDIFLMLFKSRLTLATPRAWFGFQ